VSDAISDTSRFGQGYRIGDHLWRGLLLVWRRVPPALRAANASNGRHSAPLFCAAGLLSATPLTSSLRRDDSDFVVFFFSKPEDAEAFAERLGGSGCRRAAGGDPENTRATERIFQERTQGAERQLM
jgi:hypothetical protein